MTRAAAWNPVGALNPAWKGGEITDPEWFQQRYVVEQLSLRQVARLAGRSVRTAARWAKRHGVETRSSRLGIELRTASGEKRSNWIESMVRNCVDCDAPLHQPRLLPKGKERRCADCDRIWRSEFYKGKNNPNYKGIVDIANAVRVWSNDIWRPRVFKRDGYCCQKCGDSSGGNLRAHHIRRFGVLIEDALVGIDLSTPESRLATIEALKEDQSLNDIGNGVTLCADCHNTIHRGQREDVVAWR